MINIHKAHTIIGDTKANIFYAHDLITYMATTINSMTTQNPPIHFKVVDPAVTINPAIKVPNPTNKNTKKNKYLKF